MHVCVTTQTMNDADAVRWVRTGYPFPINNASDALEACIMMCVVVSRACEFFSGVMAREDNPCWLDQQVFEDVTDLAANGRNISALAARLAMYSDQVELLQRQARRQ
jgi:hypothetical protein